MDFLALHAKYINDMIYILHVLALAKKDMDFSNIESEEIFEDANKHILKYMVLVHFKSTF